jgi:hypothetical protein
VFADPPSLHLATPMSPRTRGPPKGRPRPAGEGIPWLGLEELIVEIVGCRQPTVLLGIAGE